MSWHVDASQCSILFSIIGYLAHWLSQAQSLVITCAMMLNCLFYLYKKILKPKSVTLIYSPWRKHDQTHHS